MLISCFREKDSIQYIENMEGKYKIELPKTYRKFLEKYNGGNTPKTKFNLNRVSSDLKGFFGFTREHKQLDYTYLDERGILDTFIQENMFPIAINDFADYITIALEGNEKGKI